MTILIAHNDIRTTQALQQELRQAGFERIQTAATFERAVRAIETIGPEVHWIIAQREVPAFNGDTLSDVIAHSPSLDLAPLIVLQEKGDFVKHARIDAVLETPFRTSMIWRNFDKAYRHRSFSRDHILCVCDKERFKALENRIVHLPGHWQKLLCAESIGDIEEHLSQSQKHIGGILLEPHACNKLPQNWLRRFRKSRFGNSLVWAAIGRHPELIYGIRTYCDFYFDYESSAQGWVAGLSNMSEWLLSKWQVACAREHIKTSLDENKVRKVERCLDKLATDDHFEWLCYRAELAAQKGHPREALEFYLRASVLNPCHPRPYILGAPLMLELRHKCLPVFLSTAELYCPNNKPVRDMAKHFRAQILEPSLSRCPKMETLTGASES